MRGQCNPGLLAAEIPVSVRALVMTQWRQLYLFGTTVPSLDMMIAGTLADDGK